MIINLPVKLRALQWQTIAFSVVLLLLANSVQAQTNPPESPQMMAILKHAAAGSKENQNHFIAYASKRLQEYTTNGNNQQVLVPGKATISPLCENIGFEKGTTEGWNINGDFALVNSGTDPHAGFPKVFPGGGRYSIQLNNHTTSGKMQFKSLAKRTLQVSPTASRLNIHYALVLLNYPHDSSVAAKFRIRLRNSLGEVIPCPQLNCFYSDATGPVGLASFSTALKNGVNMGGGEFPVSYSAWQTTHLDLTALMGQIVTLEVECNWCVFDYDWAYCYLDADCNGPDETRQECVRFPHTLLAPSGMASYQWLGSAGAITPAGQSSVVCNSPGMYTLQCSPVATCSQFPLYYFYKIAQKPNAAFSIANLPCQLVADFTASVQNPLTSSGLHYRWNVENTIYTGSVVTHTFMWSGLKSIQLQVKSGNGCADTLKKYLQVNASVKASITAPLGQTITQGSVLPLNGMALSTGTNFSYQWYNEAGLYAGNQAIQATVPGYYLLEVKDPKTGCRDTTGIRLWQENALVVPNVFSPNGDGSNDFFELNTATLPMANVKIFDRWGNLVFEKSVSAERILWDGKNKRHENCSDGTFFYIIEGRAIDGRSILEHGTLSLFR
ncbi:MAG: gliding motility-associated C-terminal domain-containing protein [Sediminibacterium sp.]|nr:gliding motility-associated C-terminal domain-containing protein [Sediminibacterium sp.]